MPGRLFNLIQHDMHAMACLRTARDFGPAGAYLAAGFIRNRYWDSLYEAQVKSAGVRNSDIDVVHFDAENVSPERDTAFEYALKKIMPDEDWQVRNQARMHDFAGHSPFHDLVHALMHWSETATAVAVRLNRNDTLEYLAPFGLDDLYEHRLRITPIVSKHDPAAFQRRVETKKWRERWPNVTVLDRA